MRRGEIIDANLNRVKQERIDGEVKNYNITPEDFGLHKIKPEKLYGGDSVESAARIFLNILKGNGTAEQSSVVLANAALGIKVYHPDKDLDECMLMARESLESKSALEKLKRITNL